MDPNAADLSDEPMAKTATVTQIYADLEYGYLLTPDCREIQFSRDAVMRDEFDAIEVGSEVRFEETDGPNGPVASVVDLISRPLPAVEDDQAPLDPGDKMPEMPSPWNEDNDQD